MQYINIGLKYPKTLFVIIGRMKTFLYQNKKSYLIAVRNKRLKAPDPTIKLGPSESCWKPLATIPTIANKISGADLGPRDMSIKFATVPFQTGTLFKEIIERKPKF